MLEFLRGLLVGAHNQADPRRVNIRWCEHRAPLAWENDGGAITYQVCTVCGTVMDIRCEFPS